MRLNRQIDTVNAHFRQLDSYYRGVQPLGFLPEHVRDEVGTRLRPLSVNFARLVVDAVEERLDVEGFRLSGDDRGSEDLWGLWQRNGMDEMSQLVHLEALVHGRAYVSIWPGPDGPVIAPESGRQVTVLVAPHNRERRAALKRWVDPDAKQASALLYLPDRIVRFESTATISIDTTLNESPLYLTSGPHTDPYWVDFTAIPSTQWAKVEEIPNPLGVVPVIPFENRSRLLSFGESELADVINLVDAIGKLWTDAMVTSEYSAAPRRYVTGLPIQEDDDGNVIPPFDSRAGRLWQAEGEEARFGQFAEADLTTYSQVIEQLVSQLGAISGLPPHYLNLGAEPASADAIRSSEASLVAKVRRKHRQFGGAWERVMRLAVASRDGYLPPRYDALETMWRDPETRTVAQQTDAALKRRDMGFPLDVLAEDLGYSPQQVERILRGQAREASRSLASVTGPLPDTPAESFREIDRDEEGAR